MLKLKAALVANPELLTLLAPEHGRSSCSDTQLNNGFNSATAHTGRTAPRCLRCALLELAKSDEWDTFEEFDFDFNVFGAR
jgi:hypothetical protein